MKCARRQDRTHRRVPSEWASATCPRSPPSGDDHHRPACSRRHPVVVHLDAVALLMPDDAGDLTLSIEAAASDRTGKGSGVRIGSGTDWKNPARVGTMARPAVDASSLASRRVPWRTPRLRRRSTDEPQQTTVRRPSPGARHALDPSPHRHDESSGRQALGIGSECSKQWRHWVGSRPYRSVLVGHMATSFRGVGGPRGTSSSRSWGSTSLVLPGTEEEEGPGPRRGPHLGLAQLPLRSHWTVPPRRSPILSREPRPGRQRPPEFRGRAGSRCCRRSTRANQVGGGTTRGRRVRFGSSTGKKSYFGGIVVKRVTSGARPPSNDLSAARPSYGQRIEGGGALTASCSSHDQRRPCPALPHGRPGGKGAHHPSGRPSETDA